MANITGMIVAELKRRRAKAVAALEQADQALALFTGKAPASAGAKRGPKPGRKKGGLSPEHIAKMQAGRRKNKPVPVEEGASLAEAAGD